MDKYREILKKQGYALIGKHLHSAVKLCLWLKKAIRHEGFCYKQKFYGIQSHRCLQMSPSIFCTNRCVYCWRAWEYATEVQREWDEPKEIVEQSIKAQRALISGFGGVPELIDWSAFEEAHFPNQVAISLIGEPTMYPYIDELIKEYGERGFTTFLVTNGGFPERLEKCEPTQLYISLDAPDSETYKKVDNPMEKDMWDRVLQSLEIMKEKKKIRKVIRLTMIRGLNMKDPEKYADLILKAEPDFVEVKGYMAVGYSRHRLGLAYMPTHEEIIEFSKKMNEHLGYEFLDDSKISRVVLLGSGKKDRLISRKP